MTAVSLQLLQTRCVVIQLAMNRSIRVSVVVTLKAAQRFLVLERSFCFGKFLVGFRLSVFLHYKGLHFCFLADFNIDSVF